MADLHFSEFTRDFQQDVLSRADADGEFVEASFFDIVAERLATAGEIDSFDYCHFKAHGLRVDGYSFSEDGILLNLFVSEYRGGSEDRTLTRTETETIFKRAENFLVKSLDPSFYQEMEESSAGYQLAQEINARSRKLKRARFFLFSDAVLSERVVSIESRRIKGFNCSYNVWDITRLFRLETSGKDKEDIEIDLSEFTQSGLQCLPAHLDAGGYKSYLVVLPGNVLKDLYDRYGQRLLEQNVRTFLQFRGLVNKGMRVTLENHPEMFFAYNNGITATAESVSTERDGNSDYIRKIRNLQIVNGGQTTAAVSLAGIDGDVDLEKVFIQMKLSVIEVEMSEKVVPKISEYANTQNRINAADFFSNHPFHLRIQEHAQRNWAPSKEGVQRETKWFYERARGEYGNAQSRLTQAEKKKFQLQHPRPQMFTKTDLAKYQNSWSGLPHVVSQGAQRNFSIFSNTVGKEWEKDSGEFNEYYFKELIGKAILFRGTEKIVSGADWYEGGYRANIVTYTLALLARKIAEEKLFFDFSKLWARQELSDVETKEILRLAKRVRKSIITTPSHLSNVTEWCKREDCWTAMKKSTEDYQLGQKFRDNLVTKRSINKEKEQAVAVQQTDDRINTQMKVVSLCETGVWTKLKSFGQRKDLLSPKEIDILNVAISYPRKMPTEKQSERLMKIMAKLEAGGFS